MIILDTQPVSQLQRAGSSDAARIEQRINAYSAQDVWITVITPFEQFKGCIAAISAAKAPEKPLLPFGFLQRLIEHYTRRWNGRILSFDAAAATKLQKWGKTLGWLGLTVGKPQGRSLCVWGVASGSAASHPDPGSSGMVEFSEESRSFRRNWFAKSAAEMQRIAAIALVHDATVLTANTRDFRLVPGLKVEDFT